MGLGRFRDGRFDLIVIANFVMSDTDWSMWRRSFEKASELFFDASEGQIQYGRIFVCDDSIGLDAAEIILHDSGETSYSPLGRFGQMGAALHLMPSVRSHVLTHLHEMGHLVWALGEEYTAEPVQEEINTSVAPPDNWTVPLVGSQFQPGDLVGSHAILRFGTLIQRRQIAANDETSLTVNRAGEAFSESPINDTDGQVTYQFDAECATRENSNFCIMEKGGSAAGTLDASGTWLPEANPVTEFCTDSNHDPDGNTHQEARNANSCWETITARTGFEALMTPDPAAPGPVAGFTAPDWIVLDKQPRFAVIVDRSGSMSAGHRMADARHGATFWLEFCAESDDLLSIIAYDDLIDPILGLTEVSTLGGLGPSTDAIDALTPRGRTNIRDALFEARDQIESLSTRAAVQVALLLTDGQHNTPLGSSAVEVLPDFQEGDIRLYTLGVGDPAAVDMFVLDELAARTGGRSFNVGDDQAGVVEAAMVEINAEVRGGIITTEPVLFPDSKETEMDKLFEPLLKRHKGRVPPKSRPKLSKVLAALDVRRGADIRKSLTVRDRRAVAIAVDVEKQTDRVSFSVVYPDNTDIWLYLIDPGGNAVDTTASGVAHVESAAPHEFIIVERPAAGRWTLIAIRAKPGPAITARFVAGGENRHLQVFAAATPNTPARLPVRLTASARWGHELTAIRVTAEITAPSGARKRVKLHDDASDSLGSGLYEGFFVPSEPGRYRGVITITGSPRAQIANGVRLLLHSERAEMDVDAKTPRFVRRVVVTFDVGARPKSTDDLKPHEKPARTQHGRLRPTRLVSAKAGEL